MAKSKGITSSNPLIEDNPTDTLTNILAVLDYLQFADAFTAGGLPNDSALSGRALTLRTVSMAVGSLEPMLKDASHAAR